MDSQTVSGLNKLNQDFYKKIGNSFSETRKVGWHGWEEMWSKTNKLIDYLQSSSILDLGCGNGRFCDFLAEKNFTGKYFGLDSNEQFLKETQARIAKHGLIGKVDKQDFTDLKSDKISTVDLVVCFGVLHHIPSFDLRLKLLSEVVSVNQPRFVVFTTWEFEKNARLMNRKLDLNSSGGLDLLQLYNINLKELEEGDYILDWQKENSANRYVHSFDFEEIAKLCLDSDLELIDSFSPESGDVLNKYYLCRVL